MSLRCQFGIHSPDPAARWNDGYYFSRCTRCRCDLVRTTFDGWRRPRGFRVVWLASPPHPQLKVEVSRPEAAPATQLFEGRELPIQEVLRHLMAEPDGPSCAAPVAVEAVRRDSVLEESAAAGLADEAEQQAQPMKAEVQTVPRDEPSIEAPSPPGAAISADPERDFLDEEWDYDSWRAAIAPANGGASGEPQGGKAQVGNQVGAKADGAAQMRRGAEAVARLGKALFGWAFEAGSARSTTADSADAGETEVSPDQPPTAIEDHGSSPGTSVNMPEPTVVPSEPAGHDREETNDAAEPAVGDLGEAPRLAASDDIGPAATGQSASVAAATAAPGGAPARIAAAAAAGGSLAVVLLVAAFALGRQTAAPAPELILAKAAPSAEIAEPQPRETAFVTATLLKCRNAPVQQGRTLRTLRRGDQIDIIARVGPWASIGYRGRQCWIAGRFTSSEEPL